MTRPQAPVQAIEANDASDTSAVRGKNRYATGTRFEHKTRDDLIANGYEVMRAAGSKGSTKVDLVAVKPGQLLFIQAKSNGTLGPAEWDRVVEVSGWVGAVPILAANGPRGRGVVYTRLLAPKRRGARVQPCEPFLLDEVCGVAS
jgi:Holliday junction resolvase